MAFLRFTTLCGALIGLIAMTAAVTTACAMHERGKELACKVIQAPTPADQPRTPYNQRLFNGMIQAWVPPVRPATRARS